jgi:hypothetical protein
MADNSNAQQNERQNDSHTGEVSTGGVPPIVEMFDSIMGCKIADANHNGSDTTDETLVEETAQLMIACGVNVFAVQRAKRDYLWSRF